MAFLQKIVDIVLSRESARDYDTEEYTGDIDDNFLVTQYRGKITTAVLPTNGSGYDQDIRSGDWWHVTANVNIGGTDLNIDDWLVANIDGASSIGDFFIKTSQTGVSSGVENIADGGTGAIVVGTTAYKSIEVDIVVERSSLGYSQKLNFIYDGTNLHINKGSIAPYIASNPTLGLVLDANLNGSNFELTYDNTAGLGITDLNYKIIQIL